MIPATISAVDTTISLFGLAILLGTSIYRTWQKFKETRSAKYVVGSVVLTIIFIGVWSIVGWFSTLIPIVIADLSSGYDPVIREVAITVWLILWALVGGAVGLSDFGAFGASVGGISGVILGVAGGLSVGLFLGLLMFVGSKVIYPSADSSLLESMRFVGFAIGMTGGFFAAIVMGVVGMLSGAFLGIMSDEHIRRLSQHR